MKLALALVVLVGCRSDDPPQKVDCFGTAAECGGGGSGSSAPASAEVARALAMVAKLEGELTELSARIDAAPPDQAPELRKQRAELGARLSAAKSWVLNARRRAGVHITKECLDNPLAKGCL